MKGTNTDTQHKPRPCQTAHNEQRRDNTRPGSPADLHAEAIRDAVREAFTVG